MKEFEKTILKKFGVMPFKQSDGGLGLMGKGAFDSYDKTRELEQKLAKAEAALKVAEEAIGFYADKDNWSGTSDVEFAKCIFKRTSDNEYDDEDERLPRAFTGGKRARQAMASMKKVLDE